ncbi:MAG: uroporphyrinogen-III C-methyltransferase, partial [Candidatus Atribacteria bacterium]|nr:uroporphyrinogen-III C-methyltransferase [Candidatus Atribacteria bacterium]
LKDADTVVFDRLADRKILDFVRSGTELIDVGKTPGYHPVSQGRINEILVERARQGKNVVRLKGGDPFVFGRGGEEALFLAREGIPFEVIPGITSAISVPAYAGIPVTYRDICSSFHVFSGHEGPGKTNDFDWDTISRLKGTLVFLMGVKNMDLIVRSLMEHGKSPETPAAVIMEGTGAGQKTVVGTLSNIFRKSRDEGIENPAVIVIGDVVKLRQELCWFEKKKLFGKRILITGIADSGLNLEATKNINGENDIIEPRERNGLNQLIEEGVDVVFCPTIKINLVSEFIDEILDTLPLFDLLVFTSKNGVESFRQALRRKKYDIRRLRDIRLAVVGIRTGEELEKCFLYPDMMPTDYTSQALLERLKKENNIRNVALITSDIGGEKLEEGLKKG